MKIYKLLALLLFYKYLHFFENKYSFSSGSFLLSLFQWTKYIIYWNVSTLTLYPGLNFTLIKTQNIPLNIIKRVLYIPLKMIDGIFSRINYILFLLFLLLFNIPTLFLCIFLLPLSRLKRNELVFRFHVHMIESVYNLFFTFEIINQEHYKNVFFKERYIYCPNHQTGDLYLFKLFVNEDKVQHLSVFHDSFAKYVPIVGWIWHILDHVYVQSKKTVEMATNHLLKHKHLSLCIFPEVNKQSKLKFNENVKSGAFQMALNTGIPILPIYHNLGKGIVEAYAYIHYNAHIKIYIGDPIYPKGKTVEELKEEYVKQMKTIENTYFMQ